MQSLGPMIAALASLILMGTVDRVPAAGESPQPVHLVAAPPVRSVGPAAPDLYDNLAVPAFQLIGAEGIVVLSFLAADHVGGLGAAPIAAIPLSSCSIGALSRRHRGSCWHSLAGAGIGIASGLVVYGLLAAFPSLNPWRPNPDDTQTFANTMTTLVYVGLIGIPVGSVVGWNIGRVAVPESGSGEASAQSRELPAQPPPQGPAFRADGAPRWMVPLFAGRF